MSVAGYFELDAAHGRTIACKIGQAVAGWRREAGRVGLPEPQIGRMTSVFERADREQARAFGG